MLETAGHSLREMLVQAEGHVSERQLRFFNLWCCHVLRPYLIDRRSRDAANLADAQVDRLVAEAERHPVWLAAGNAVEELSVRVACREDAADFRHRRVYGHAALVAQKALYNTLPNEGVLSIAQTTAFVFGWANDDGPTAEAGSDDLRDAHQRLQEAVFRDIVPDPTLMIAWDPAWRSGDVVALARGIDQDRAYERLPILADALMDAGCDGEAVLAHCFHRGPHVRGCWLLERILGR